MLSNWQESFEHLLSSEGGFIRHPSDPGGMTNLGVTKAAWENWMGRASDEYEMRQLTPEQVEPMYKEKYWDACRCDELPPGLDYLVFDFAVHAGPGRSIKTLQTAVGATPDGRFGAMTMEAVMNTGHHRLIEHFSEAKEEFYRALAAFETFGKGWLYRLAEVKSKAASMIG